MSVNTKQCVIMQILKQIFQYPLRSILNLFIKQTLALHQCFDLFIKPQITFKLGGFNGV